MGSRKRDRRVGHLENGVQRCTEGQIEEIYKKSLRWKRLFGNPVGRINFNIPVGVEGGRWRLRERVKVRKKNRGTVVVCL